MFKDSFQSQAKHNKPHDKNMFHYVKEHVARIVENSKDFAVIAFDAHQNALIWNPGAELIFGYKADEIIGKNAEMIFTPEDCKHHVPQQEFETAASKGSADDERWHLRKGGDRIFVSGTMMSVRDESGNLMGFTKIVRDITPIKHAQEVLVEARSKAEAENAAKTEFLNIVSHEIRNPMNAIIGLSHILEKSEPLTEKQREYITTLHTSAEFLLSLVDNLLDISKLEAHSVKLEKVPFNLLELVEDILRMMTPKAEEKGIALTMQINCEKYCNYWGDPVRIRQIMVNLYSNALKFTKKGNIHVCVTSQHTDRKGIEDTSISVKDTGIGIPPDKLKAIFEKFWQAEDSTNRKYGGTGLGLAISKNLAELMGGSLTVKSEPGGGAEFTLHLPLELADNTEVQPVSLRSARELGLHIHRKHLLLVEDYEANVLVASHIVKMLGYSFDVAHNGEEAVEKIHANRNKYMAVLMDVQMRDMDGFEATRLIRKEEKAKNLPRLPIIAVTAYSMRGDRERCIAAGMDQYISKPFQASELKAALEPYMRLTNPI